MKKLLNKIRYEIHMDLLNSDYSIVGYSSGQSPAWLWDQLIREVASCSKRLIQYLYANI